MKDIKGNPLKAGDRVVFSPRTTCHLFEATIARFTESGQAVFEPGSVEARKNVKYLLKINPS